MSAFEFVGDIEGTHGIPMMFTRGVIVDLFHDRIDCRHPDPDVLLVAVPIDALSEIVAELSGVPVFSWAESSEYEGCIAAVKSYIFDQQGADALDALLAGKGVERETVEEYIKHVCAWVSDGQIETECGPVDSDPPLMRLSETEHFGRFLPDDYEGSEFPELVGGFRNGKVITALNRYARKSHDEDFTASDVDLTEIPIIRAVLEARNWEDVRRLSVDLDPRQWDDPPMNIGMMWVKVRTIDELVDRSYTATSAELTSRAVVKKVSYTWS